jgi:diacylglycerol kinase family enzyme/membrane-associated phospholipid phosphatase
MRNMPRLLVIGRARRARRLRASLLRLDCSLFDRVAGAHSPRLDRVVPLLSRSANHSAIWIAIATGLGASGGRRGVRAAVRGLGSVAVTSLVVNQGIKRVVRRARPSLRNVPVVRRVAVPPLTTSFPSGHAASAAAFTTGVAAEFGPVAPALALLAAAVGASRVYVGVHYPLDVAVGAIAGAGIATATRRVWPVLPERSDSVPPSDDRRSRAIDRDGQTVTVIVNPASGRGSADVAEVVRARLPAARVVELEGDEPLARRLEDVASACEVLGIAGGDGSIATAAEIALAYSRPLLVLPAGTLNHLTRDLRIEDADDALDAFAAGQTVGVDIAAIDGQLFINTAGLGAYPQMLANRERFESRLGRWPGQVLAFAKTVLDATPLDLTLDGNSRPVWTVFIGNCRYEPSGLGPSWRPRLDDGHLDVRLLRADLPRSRLRLAAAMLSGRLARSAAYSEMTVRELRIDSSGEPLAIARDGERSEAHAHVLIDKLPQRLEVFARHQPSG